MINLKIAPKHTPKHTEKHTPKQPAKLGKPNIADSGVNSPADNSANEIDKFFWQVPLAVFCRRLQQEFPIRALALTLVCIAPLATHATAIDPTTSDAPVDCATLLPAPPEGVARRVILSEHRESARITFGSALKSLSLLYGHWHSSMMTKPNLPPKTMFLWALDTTKKLGFEINEAIRLNEILIAAVFDSEQRAIVLPALFQAVVEISKTGTKINLDAYLHLRGDVPSHGEVDSTQVVEGQDPNSLNLLSRWTRWLRPSHKVEPLQRRAAPPLNLGHFEFQLDSALMQDDKFGMAILSVEAVLADRIANFLKKQIALQTDILETNENAIVPSAETPIIDPTEEARWQNTLVELLTAQLQKFPTFAWSRHNAIVASGRSAGIFPAGTIEVYDGGKSGREILAP